MKRLDKTQLAEKQRLIEAIQVAKSKLEEEINGYNTAVESAKAEVERAAEALNEVISDANNWRGDVLQAMEDYYADRSEKWQEGDAGQQYSDWKDQFGNELDEVVVNFPDELEMPDVDHADDLEALPDDTAG